MLKNKILQGTKAETLFQLSSLGYNVPKVYYFTVKEWNEEEQRIINQILELYNKKSLAIRSSTNAEDREDSSMAGAFESLLNVKPVKNEIIKAVAEVISSYDNDLNNHILIQPMVENVKMSGRPFSGGNGPLPSGNCEFREQNGQFPGGRLTISGGKWTMFQNHGSSPRLFSFNEYN